MPSSVVVHAVVFTAGALIGGGIAAAVSSKQRPSQIPAHLKPPGPVIDVDITGKTKISADTTVRSELASVLKYGHPGVFYLVTRRRNFNALT